MKVEIYSDVACPWCYIGTARFERALAAFPAASDVEVSFRPFQLNPSAPAVAQPLYDYYDQLFGPGFRSRHAEVAAAAAREGLDFHLDRALAVNTFTAHRLLWLTERDYGATTQRALKAALLRTYFTDGGNVGDTDTLVTLAVEVGVDRAQATEWLSGADGTTEVTEEIDTARAIGVQAVPTFVFDGRYAVQGAQDASVFLRALEQVVAESASGGDDGDAACSDGACAV
jgi:predicted DsbA family dithiol-disulfide isomerase